jgi:hypothetical protein
MPIYDFSKMPPVEKKTALAQQHALILQSCVVFFLSAYPVFYILLILEWAELLITGIV